MNANELDLLRIVGRMRSQNAQNWQRIQDTTAAEWARHHSRDRARVLLAFLRISPIAAIRLTPQLKRLLGVESPVDVALYGESGQHTRDRHPRDALEVLGAMPLDDSRLLYYGEHDKGREFELCFRIHSGAIVVTILKYLRAAAGRAADEWWLKTAFKIDERTLRARVRKHKLTYCFGISRQVGHTLIDSGRSR